MIDKLDSSNALLYAAKHYDNPSCMDVVEFYDDLKRFKYIKRLLNKYRDSRQLKIRLVMNHIILLYNLFGQEAATRLLFLKLDGYYSELIPFLEYLNRVPEVVHQIGLPPKDIHTAHIKPDIRLFELIKETVDGK
jgi:hypothetical protein